MFAAGSLMLSEHMCLGHCTTVKRPGIRDHRGMKLNLDTLRGDIFGGVTSMVVLLPILPGFRIASGARICSSC